MEEDKAALKTPHLKGLLVLAVGKHGGVESRSRSSNCYRLMFGTWNFRCTFVADRSVVRHAGFRGKCVPPPVSRAIENPNDQHYVNSHGTRVLID
jgi:hypothetical protein